MNAAKRLPAKRTDPILDGVMERLFGGRDAETFENTIRPYAAWRTNSKVTSEEYLSREEFIIAIDSLIESAEEAVREAAEEDRKNDYPEAWEGA